MLSMLFGGRKQLTMILEPSLFAQLFGGKIQQVGEEGK